MVTNILSSRPQSSASAKEPFSHCLEIVKYTFFKNKLGKIMSKYVCVVSLVVSRQCLLLHNMYCRFSIILVLAVGRKFLGTTGKRR